MRFWQPCLRYEIETKVAKEGVLLMVPIAWNRAVDGSLEGF